MNEELKNLLKLLNSEDPNDVILGVGIFDAQYYNKGIIFPREFKHELKRKWYNTYSLEYRRRILNMDKMDYKINDEECIYLYLI